MAGKAWCVESRQCGVWYGLAGLAGQRWAWLGKIPMLGFANPLRELPSYGKGPLFAAVPIFLKFPPTNQYAKDPRSIDQGQCEPLQD